MTPSDTQVDVASAYEGYKAMYNQHYASTSTSSATGTNAPGAGQTAADKAKKLNRLPDKARAILRDYYSATNSSRPSLEEKRELLARIHQISGAEWYTMNSLNNWFAQRRRQDKANEKKDTASILWPSLDSEEKIENLRILYGQRPPNIPLSRLIPTWVPALGALEQHVQAWLEYHDPTGVSDIVDRKPTPHLPTPETTASPEPSHLLMRQSPIAMLPQSPPVLQPFSTMSPAVKQQQFSPVQPHFVPAYIHSPLQGQNPAMPPMNYIPYHPQVHAYSNQSPPAQSPPPPAYSPSAHTATQAKPDEKIAIPDVAPPPVPVSVSQPTPPPGESLFRRLAVSIKDVESPLLGEVTITSIEDIDKAFEPYEWMMRDLLAKAGSGLYTPIGLHPALITPRLDGSDASDGDDMDLSV